jgi:O-antigen/teichoic acid export membrane protein
VNIWGFASGAPKLYFLLIPLGVLLSGLYRVAQYWAIRVQALQQIAGTSVKQMIGGQAVNLAMGVIHPSPFGLIVGQIVSSSAGVSSLSRGTKLIALLRTHRASILQSRCLWQVAKKHRHYALIQLPSTLLNSLGFYLPGILILPYFGANFAGQLNLAQRLGRIPIGLVGSSLSQVFFSEAASLARTNPQRLRPLFNSVSRKLAVVSTLVLAACLLAPLIVPVVFGRRWHDAGQLTIWLGFGLAFQLCVSPLSNIPNVVRRLRGQLIIDACRAALVFAAFYVPFRLGLGGWLAVACYSAVLVANYSACYLLYRHQVAAHCEQLTPKENLEPQVVAI